MTFGPIKSDPAFDENRWQELRRIYTEGSNIYDQAPVIRDFMMRMAKEKVQHLWTQNKSWWGFHHAPFSNDTDNADVVMYGIGHDTSSQEMGDTRFAPMYLRNCSQYIAPPVHSEWGIAPYEQCRVIDRGDLEKFAMDYHEGIEWDIKHALEWSRNGALPLRIGGTHCVLGGTINAARQLADMYVPGKMMGGVLFDGHSDMFTPNDTGGIVSTDWVNGGQVGRAIYEGWVDPEKVFWFGMRGFGIDPVSGSAIGRQLGVTQVGPVEIEEKGVQFFVDMMDERLGETPCFLSCDLDALDPAEGGGVTQRDGFGLTMRELRMLSRVMKGKNLLAADICEYAPAHDTHGRATGFNVAALIFEYLCMLVDAKTRFNGGEYRQTKWDLNLSTSASYPGETFMERWEKEKAEGII